MTQKANGLGGANAATSTNTNNSIGTGATSGIPQPSSSTVAVSTSSILINTLAADLTITNIADIYCNDAKVFDVVTNIFDFSVDDAETKAHDRRWHDHDIQYGLYILWGYAESGKSELATQLCDACALSQIPYAYHDMGEPGAKHAFPRSNEKFETFVKNLQKSSQSIIVLDSLSLLPQQELVADSPSQSKGVPSAYLPMLIDLDRWFMQSKKIVFGVVNPHQDWKDVDQAAIHAGAVSGVFDFSTYQAYFRRRTSAVYNKADRLTCKFNRTWAASHPAAMKALPYSDFITHMDDALGVLDGN